MSSLLAADGLAEIPGKGCAGAPGGVVQVRLVEWWGGPGLTRQSRFASLVDPPPKGIVDARRSCA